MNVKFLGWRPAASPHHPFLDGKQRWPARSRHLLEETQALCLGWLENAVERSLLEFERQLTQQVTQSRDPRVQQQLLDSRHLLTVGSAALARDFLDQVTHGFEQLDAINAPEPPESESWSLLDTAEQDLQAALDRIAAQSAWRSGVLLYELGYRFAVLMGCPPLEGLQLPLGPHALTQAWRNASTRLAMPLAHQLILLQSFEQNVIDTLAPLYETINEHLQADGILPHLRPYAHVRHVPIGKTGAPDVAPYPPIMAAGAVSAPIADNSIGNLLQLRQLLAQHRREPRQQEAGVVQYASNEQLQEALHQLGLKQEQQSHSGLRDARGLHDALLAQFNSGTLADMAKTGLSDAQYDTVELLGLLVQALANQLHPGNRAQAMLDRLHIPLLRLALDDPRFFEASPHPARKLLETVAQTAYDWLEGNDGAADQELASTLEQVLQRANNEPPSSALYTALHQEIESHMAVLTRKARINERRQIEAMQGRERLELARQQASAVLATRFERAAPRGLLRVLLERAWSDVLALTLLRHGEHSEEFFNQLRLTDQLLGRLPNADRLQLRHQVEHGLLQIGMPENEAQHVARRLLEQPDVAAVGRLSPNDDLAQTLAQRQRLGGGLPSGSDVVDTLPLDDLENQILDRLQQLPFGTWFEFRDAANAQVSRCKLAWYSARSGRSLLVNRRGTRTEMSLGQLASAVAQGHASQLSRSRQNVFERAWRSFANELGAANDPSDAESRVGFRA
ncbi:MAG: DUF1631 family protein [Dyella sp.]